MLTTPPSLLERLRESRAQEAWGRFVEMYTPLLYDWARRLARDEHEAADLVQDLVAALVEELPRFRYDPGRSFRAWLKTVLLNRWRNRRRRAAGERHAGPEALGELAAPEEAPGLEEAEYRQYLVGRALAIMRAEFQPTTWRACWEFVVAGRPAEEVAAELGLTANAVYLAKGRVLRRLREELAGLFD